jgi:hypothetical protein
MEKTMFKRFTMGQALRALFQEQSLPPVLHSYISSYEKTFNADIQGTFINEDLAFDDTFTVQEEEPTWKESQLSTLEPEPYKLLKQWIDANDPDHQVSRTAYFRKKIGRLGQNFQTRPASLGDSCVVFNHPGRPSHQWAMGSIDSIFSHTHHTAAGGKKTQTFVLIKEYASLAAEHSLFDHYSDFPEAGGRLFYNRFDKVPLLLPIEGIQCHAAYAEEVSPEIEAEVIVAIPLNRVCNSLFVRDPTDIEACRYNRVHL